MIVGQGTKKVFLLSIEIPGPAESYKTNKKVTYEGYQYKVRTGQWPSNMQGVYCGFIFSQ